MKCTLVRSDDRLRRPSPLEGWRGVLPCADVGCEGLAQGALCGEVREKQRLLRQDSEPPLDLVEPRGAGRGVVEVNKRPLSDPMEFQRGVCSIFARHEIEGRIAVGIEVRRGEKSDFYCEAGMAR